MRIQFEIQNRKNMSDSENQEEVEMTEEEKEAARQAENEEIWQCFHQYDIEQQGTMNTEDLKQALEQLGERVSDTQVFRMISDVDPNNIGTLSFYAFKELVLTKREEAKGTSNADLLDAYVAMGGDEDGGGCVDAEMLIKTIRDEFEMTIDIEALIAEVDEDGSGEIEFDEFKELLAGQADEDADGDEEDGNDGD